MLQTLKWSDDGELSELDMTRILESLKEKEDYAQMGQSNPGWRTNSPMQE